MSIVVADLNLSIKSKKDLRILALQGMPEEVCGIICPHNIIVQLPNTFAGDRCHGFDMEVDMGNSGHIKAIWHSHPTGPDFPSKDDIPSMNLLAERGLTYPWLIVTHKHVTAWRVAFD